MKIIKEWLESLNVNTPEQYQAMTENINAERKEAGLRPLNFESFASIQGGVSDAMQGYLRTQRGTEYTPQPATPAGEENLTINSNDIANFIKNFKK